MFRQLCLYVVDCAATVCLLNSSIFRFLCFGVAYHLHMYSFAFALVSSVIVCVGTVILLLLNFRIAFDDYTLKYVVCVCVVESVYHHKVVFCLYLD